MEDILKVITLSLIEGVTEFLPISSTGHLIVGTALLDFDAMGTVFEIFIQIGAVVAVLYYYRKTLLGQAAGASSNSGVRRFWLLTAVAFVPAAVLGVLFHEQIVSLLFSPTLVALSLIVGGFAFLFVERIPRFRQNDFTKDTKITDVTLPQAVTVGLVQVLALIPGMSRSGTTIVGGMLAGMDRRLATEFSFFLAIPVLGGATIYKLTTSLHELRPDDLALLLFGAILSGVFALFAMEWLLKYVSRNSFVIFGYYRIAAGLLILLGTISGLIS